MIIARSDGYIGIMIDDLTMKGAEEPCQSSLADFMLEKLLLDC